MRLFRRLRALFRKEEFDHQLADEMAFHLAKQIEQSLAAGMAPEEARYAALRRFGGVEQVKEQCRDARRLNRLENFLHDVRYGVRQLRRDPGFAAVAVLTLVLGIGANTAIFSVVDAVLIRPLPYRDAGRLVYISEFWPRETPVRTVPSPDFANWSEHSRLCDGMAAYGGGAEMNLTSPGEPERLLGARVTWDFFPLLGVQPSLGRGFLREEDQPGGRQVVLLSHELWQRRFGSNPRVVGTSVQLDGSLHTVVGVIPAGFRFPDDEFKAELFLPMVVARAAEWGTPAPEKFRLVRTLARLKPGVTIDNVKAELTGLVQQTAGQEPPQFIRMRAGMEVQVTPLHARLAAPARPILLVLFGSVALLLLMSCVNVAGLQLARGAARRKELAVRAALGAPRLRIAAQLLTESLVLAMAAGPVAVVVGFAGLRALQALGPPQIPHLESIHLDLRVLLFALLVATLTGLLFGLSPAILASRVQLDEALKQSTSRSTSGQEQHRLRSILVTTEIALAVVLLIGAGLLTRSFVYLTSINPGFDPRQLLTLRISLSGSEYSKPEQQAAFYEQLLQRVRALPAIQSADAGSGLPLIGWGSLRGTDVEGQPAALPGLRPDIACDVVSPGYFQTLRIPMVAGRAFTARDRQGVSPVAVVNRAFVHQFFPDVNPLGKHLGSGARGGPWREIVGIVGNVRQLGPDHAESPEIYIPYEQEPSADMNVVLRAANDPLNSVAAVKAAVRSVDANLPVYDVATMDQRLSESVAPQRFNALLVGMFAVLALGLAAVGIYGVLAYSVERRTHEIGIRLAMGASREDVLAQVVGEGMRLVAVGMGIGLAGSLALARVLRTLLFGVHPTDPVTLAAVSAGLALVAALACYLPARRATKVDPMVALRYE
ncbi:MAG: ADOP family duplicated permease [Terriglobia bacterium]